MVYRDLMLDGILHLRKCKLCFPEFIVRAFYNRRSGSSKFRLSFVFTVLLKVMSSRHDLFLMSIRKRSIRIE